MSCRRKSCSAYSRKTQRTATFIFSWTPVLVIGLEKSRFFADAIPVHILLTIPEHGVSIQLTGTVSAQTVVLTAPTSRMKDEDIQTLVQIRDTIQSVLQFVQTAANSVQNAG